MVDEPVDHGGGDDVVAEDLAPAAEGFVGGDDQRGSFVAGGDELEEQVGGLGLEGDVADFVDDEQRVAAQADQFVLEASAVVGLGEPGDPLGGGGEQDAVPGLAGADSEPDGEVGLAGAGRSEEDHVVPGGDEVQGAEVGDQVAGQSAGVVEVELLEGLARREPGSADPALAAVGIAGGDLALQAGDQVLLVGPGLCTGAFGEPVYRLAQRGCLQRPGQIGDLGTEVGDRFGLAPGWHQNAPSSRDSPNPNMWS